MSELTIEELSEAFAPCTIPGLADEWQRLNREIADIRRERDNIEAILLAHCETTGEVVEGKTVAVHAHRYVSESREGRPIWKTKLEVKRDTAARGLRVIRNEGVGNDERIG